MKNIFVLGCIAAGYLLYEYNREGFVSEVKLLKETKKHIIIKKNKKKYCVSKKCTHQGCIVSLVKNKLVCPCHGARFTLDGKVEKHPYTGEKISNLKIKDIEDLI